MDGFLVREQRHWWVLRSCLAYLSRTLDDSRIAQASQVPDAPADMTETLQLQRAYLLACAGVFREGLFPALGNPQTADEIRDPGDDLVDIALRSVHEVVLYAATLLQAHARAMRVRRARPTVTWTACRAVATSPTLPTAPTTPTIVFVGDLSLGDLAGNSPCLVERMPPLYFVSDALLAAMDADGDGALRIANLTCPLVVDAMAADWKRAKPEGATFVNFRCDPAAGLAVLRRLRLDCVCLANNHIFDYGRAGAMATAEALSGAGIAHAGLRAASLALLRLRENVWLHNVFFEDAQRAPDMADQLHWAQPDTARAHVAQLRALLSALPAGACIVLCVYLNQGDGFVALPPSPCRLLLVRALVDCALAVSLRPVVLCYGPHCAGPVEMYRGCAICYSGGDFIGPYPAVFGRSDLTYIARVTVASNAVPASVALTPCRITGCRPLVLRAGDADYDAALALMERQCARFTNTTTTRTHTGLIVRASF